MKVLVSDFDRTFYTDSYLDNIKKANEFVDKGNVFIIATGRNFNSLFDDIYNTNLKYNYLICSDGAIICDNKNNIVIKKNICKEQIKSIFKYLDDSNDFSEILIDNGEYFDIDLDNDSCKLLARPNNFNKVANDLEKLYDLFPDIRAYLSHNWLNIIRYDVTKSSAINYLQKLNNYNKDDIYTIGDNTNDLEMLKEYNGFVMINGNEIVKNSITNKVNTFIELIDILLNNK